LIEHLADFDICLKVLWIKLKNSLEKLKAFLGFAESTLGLSEKSQGFKAVLMFWTLDHNL